MQLPMRAVEIVVDELVLRVVHLGGQLRDRTRSVRRVRAQRCAAPAWRGRARRRGRSNLPGLASTSLSGTRRWLYCSASGTSSPRPVARR